MSEWYPAALIRLGPKDKVTGKRNANRGAVLHSMVGYFAGAMAEFDRTSRRASWHFSIRQDGTVYQHYPLTASTWHAGSDGANNQYIGIEHEGGFSPTDEPLTAAQINASVTLVKWIAAQGKWTPSRTSKKTLFEHRELSSTLCPSSRIPWDAYTTTLVPPQPSWKATYWAGMVNQTPKYVRTETVNGKRKHVWEINTSA